MLTSKTKKTLKLSRPKDSPKGYTDKEIDNLLQNAARQFPDCIGISHILPKAFCLAKSAKCCAIFAAPEADREPQVRQDSTIFVRSESASHCVVGKWYRLAYISRPHCHSTEVIHEKNAKKQTTGQISESTLQYLSHRGTVRICIQAMGRGFQIKGYTNGRPKPIPFDLRGKNLEELVAKALALQIKAQKTVDKIDKQTKK